MTRRITTGICLIAPPVCEVIFRGVDEELIREARHGSRLNKKFCLDLGAGDMVEQTLDEFIDEHAEEEVVVEKRNNKELLLFNEDLGNNNLTYTFKKKDAGPAKEKKAKRLIFFNFIF